MHGIEGLGLPAREADLLHSEDPKAFAFETAEDLAEVSLRTESGLMMVNVRLDIWFLVSFAWRIRGADYTRACDAHVVQRRNRRARRFREVDRQVERERRALPRLRRDFDLAVVQLDEVARQREPEAGPARARPAAVFGLVELVEDPLQLVGGDADSLVGDVDAHRVEAERRVGCRDEATVNGRPSRRAG